MYDYSLLTTIYIQIRKAFRNILRTLPDVVHILALFLASIAIFALLALKLMQNRYVYATVSSQQKTNINCVYVLQKNVLRIVCNVDYRYHSNELFKELRILKLFDIIELKTAMIMYKANKTVV